MENTFENQLRQIRVKIDAVRVSIVRAQTALAATPPRVSIAERNLEQALRDLGP